MKGGGMTVTCYPTEREELHSSNISRVIRKEIFGYKTQSSRRALCIAGYILSCGALLLLFYWKPEWDVWANCIRCSLEEADIVLLRTTDEFRVYSRKTVTWISVSALIRSRSDYPATAEEDSIFSKAIMKPSLQVKSIQVQKIRYVWNICAKHFQKVGALEDHHTCSAIHAKFGSGLTCNEQYVRRVVCGPNTIDVPVIPVWKLLVKEVLNPFYVFQLFSVCLWFAEDYMEYATAIIIMSLLSIFLTVYDLRRQSVKLHRLVESHNNIMVTVCRNKEGFQELESHHLVPGDMLVLKEGKTLLPCDAILISGQCVVNESMLTGFNTAKGDLVRSILYPKPMNFKLYRDALRFLMCLIAFAAIGMIYTVCVFALNGEEAGEVVKKALDVITIAVPPALPAALTTGIIYTQQRLKKKGIFCISPQRINMCGQLNLICFDKTGTLTEDGLDLWGLLPSERNCFQDIHSFPADHSLPWGPVFRAMAVCHSLIVWEGKIQGDPLDVKMFEATNWVIDDSSGRQNEGQGSTRATVVRPGPKASCAPVEGVTILRQFPFSSALQRMSVIAQEIGGEKQVFTKGAPEMVAMLCRAETVPSNFESKLLLYTAQGFRVIGLACKSLQAGKQSTDLTREEAESDLTFLGLLIMENRLKKETKPVLEELSAARIRSVMVTGDNIQTAVTVARNAGMISPMSRMILVEANKIPGSFSASITWKPLEENKPEDYRSLEDDSQTKRRIKLALGSGQYHFAMSGKTYQTVAQHFRHLLPKLLLNGTVFARMSPGQKSSLVEEFQKLDYFVGMCGDGANDCGALKVAHAGISLSEQEASVASPFTSRTPSIACVPELIKEGRAALVTSFCMFKYMALYSTIQYLGVLLLYWQLNSFGNYQFLFQDLAITTVIGVTMSFTGACPKLVPYRPPSQLISPPLLLSVVLNILFSLSMQIFGFVVVQEQPWYSKTNIHSACLSANNHMENSSSISSLGLHGMRDEAHGQTDNGYKSYENTTVWLLSTINCLIVALVFSKGKPFRQPIYTNYVFLLVLIGQLSICLILVFADIDDLYSKMDLVCTPTTWRISMVVMLAVTLAVSFLVEEAVIENRALWLLLKKTFRYHSKSHYKRLQRVLEQDSAWPPLNETFFSDSVALSVEGNMGGHSNPTFDSNEDVF
ncbi:probable cation-transporting ATPase 13A4 isoform X5 [Falco biarmicus]|uniref:probable cation-transporting ATPase 13A4 isoform X4 n=1 Tax=Falco cherrug TaxID=345164 RepID=UPI002479F114|nr:probable cation-transporting ATPase 13A4 isoform X4 [Falco cherrug]XP_055672725.1 probable cation-transporting ATPase 13A4 isoform X5 [Falco peregrinus]XP_056215076.1 probable cation-transporting ATPase 13A4 isoform X5 [Falco biarmicus]